MEKLPELLEKSEHLFLVGTATFIGTLILSALAFAVAFRFASLVRGTQEIFHRFSRGLFFSISAIMLLGGFATTMVVFSAQVEAGDEAQAFIEDEFAQELSYAEIEEVDDKEVRSLGRGMPVTFAVKSEAGAAETIVVQVKGDRVSVKPGPLPDAAS